MQFKDPMQVRYWEKQLGRKLTEAEKEGQFPIKLDGHTIFLELKDLNFPYDLMDSVTLASLGKRASKLQGEE